MERILFPVLGGALIMAALADIFFTVFHASGRGGPISRRHNRILWSTFRKFGVRPDGQNRHRLLALAGPVLIVSTLGVWMLSVVIGFALVYLPQMDRFLVVLGDLRNPLVEALYYSSLVSPAVGMGDLVADPEWLRLVTAAEAIIGFAAASAAITYLLSVYGQLAAARVAANQITAYFADGMERTLERIAAAGPESFARWAEGLAAVLLGLVQAQFQYPVLPYFHSVRHARALPLQLGQLLEMERWISERDPSDPLTRLHEHPSYCALRAALQEYLAITEEYFIPQGFDSRSADAASTDAERAQRRLADYMGYPPGVTASGTR